MKNGRCRMHGGASTGARTAEGLARIRRANRKHGVRSAAWIAGRAEARRNATRMEAWLEEFRAVMRIADPVDRKAAARRLAASLGWTRRDLSALHGVIRTKNTSPSSSAPAAASPGAPAGHRPTRT
jgi:hypothetical protein